MKLLILLAVIIILSSCETLKMITQNASDYCSAENEFDRALSLAAIHLVDPDWIPICTILDD